MSEGAAHWYSGITGRTSSQIFQISNFFVVAQRVGSSRLRIWVRNSQAKWLGIVRAQVEGLYTLKGKREIEMLYTMYSFKGVCLWKQVVNLIAAVVLSALSDSDCVTLHSIPPWRLPSCVPNCQSHSLKQAGPAHSVKASALLMKRWSGLLS